MNGRPKVHVDGQGSGATALGEAVLGDAYIQQVGATPVAVLGDGHRGITGLFHLSVVLERENSLPVILGGALGEGIRVLGRKVIPFALR